MNINKNHCSIGSSLTCSTDTLRSYFNIVSLHQSAMTAFVLIEIWKCCLWVYFHRPNPTHWKLWFLR